jgi:hypothetical protein
VLDLAAKRRQVQHNSLARSGALGQSVMVEAATRKRLAVATHGADGGGEMLRRDFGGASVSISQEENQRGGWLENEGESEMCCSTLVNVRPDKCGDLRGVLRIGDRLEFER